MGDEGAMFVDVQTSVLPTGAAIVMKQDTQETTLDAIQARRWRVRWMWQNRVITQTLHPGL